jgi:anti-anti-sigma factor
MTDASTTDVPVPTIAVAGELDLSTADGLRARVDEVLEGRPSRVIFDFAALDFIDSSGLAVLIQAAGRTQVEIRNASDLIEYVLESMGLSEILKVVR